MEEGGKIIECYQRRSRARRRLEKINSFLRQLVASYLMKGTNSFLVTIIRVETSNDLKSAKIFISIFPESKEKEALKNLKEKTSELREYVGSQIKIKFLPRLEFEIDKEEKAKKRIDEILRNGAVVK